MRSGMATTPFTVVSGNGLAQQSHPQDSVTVLRHDDSVFALVAESDGAVVGLVHYLYHRSTIRTEGVCYLHDLFTREDSRGQGVGRALIEGVYAAARKARIQRVYWHTQESNSAGRRLYDKSPSIRASLSIRLTSDAPP